MATRTNIPQVNWATRETIQPFSSPLEGMVNLNVDKRSAIPPMEGFGALRLRTYRIALPGIDLPPSKVIAEWINNFSNFWPEGNHFSIADGEIRPGVTALINLTLPGGIKLYTGAVVMCVGDESFSLITLQGHMFAGWITFSSYLEDNILYAQTQALIRPNDPLYELTFMLGIGPQAEDKFWHASLMNLARKFGVETRVQQANRTIDRSFQWRYFGNLWYNAAIRSVLYQISMPFRKLFVMGRHERTT